MDKIIIFPKVLLYHVINGNLTQARLKDEQLLSSLAAGSPSIRINKYISDWPSKVRILFKNIGHFYQYLPNIVAGQKPTIQSCEENLY